MFKKAKQYNHSDLFRAHAKADSKLVKSITPKPSGLKSSNCRKSKLRKLSTTLVFTTFIENISWSMKLSSQQKMHMQPFQNVTIDVSLVLLTKSMHKWAIQEFQPPLTYSTTLYWTPITQSITKYNYKLYLQLCFY